MAALHPQRSISSTAEQTGIPPVHNDQGIHKMCTHAQAHIWEQRRQVYLGGYDDEAHAAKVSLLRHLRGRVGG